jgi:hypothetical protein
MHESSTLYSPLKKEKEQPGFKTMQRIPTLVGISGHFIGEVFPLEYGKALTVGRSRTADFSLRRTVRYRQQEQKERDKDDGAKTISSKHFQITMYNLRSIEIKNLSPNGTNLDGKPVETALINDIASKAHEISFGTDEVFRLEMRAHEDL